MFKPKKTKATSRVTKQSLVEIWRHLCQQAEEFWKRCKDANGFRLVQTAYNSWSHSMPAMRRATDIVWHHPNRSWATNNETAILLDKCWVMSWYCSNCDSHLPWDLWGVRVDPRADASTANENEKNENKQPSYHHLYTLQPSGSRESEQKKEHFEECGDLPIPSCSLV